MKKLISTIIIFLLTITLSYAQAYKTWRYRTSTDCTLLTDGKETDLCFDIASSKLYKCVPETDTTCNSIGEWKEATGRFVSTDYSDLVWGSGDSFEWTMNSGSVLDPVFFFADGSVTLQNSSLIVRGEKSQIKLANGAIFNGDTAKKVTLGITSGVYNEDLTLDFDTTSNEVYVSTSTGVNNLKLSGTIYLNPALLKVGYNGQSGILNIYNERGGTDYSNIFLPSESQSTDIEYTLPSQSNTGYMYNDGTGVLSWSAAAGGEGSAIWGSITGSLASQSDLQIALDAKENSISIGTTGQYFAYNKTWQTLDKTTVGLSSVLDVDQTNASNINSGTLDDSHLSSNVTVQGNSFNGVSQLVQLDADGKLPIIDGSQLTGTNHISDLTLGYLVKASSATSLDNSSIYETSGRIGIGTTAPAHKLDIQDLQNTSTTYRTVNIASRGQIISDGTIYTGTDEALNNVYEAFMFIPPVTDSYGWIEFKMKATTQSKQAGQLMVRVYSNSTTGGFDHPGSWIALGSSYPDIARFSTTYGTYVSAINGNLTGGTKYWLVIATSNPEVSTPAGLMIDSTSSDTGTWAYSSTGGSTTWTAENKQGYYRLVDYNTYSLVVSNAYSNGVSISTDAQPAITASSWNYGIVGSSSGRYAGVYGSSRISAGVKGYCTQSNTKRASGHGVCAGIQGESKSGYAGWFSQDQTLDMAAEDDVVYVEKYGTKGSYDSTGSTLKLNDTISSEGDLFEAIYGSTLRMRINAAGDIKLGGDVLVADVDEVGTEKIANGTFTGASTSWTLGADWSYTTNRVIHTAGTANTLSQVNTDMTSAPIVGELYFIKYSIVAGSYDTRTNGSMVITFAGNTLKKTRRQDTYYAIVRATTTDGIVFTPSSDYDGGIDSVSIVKITGGNLEVNADAVIYGNGTVFGNLEVDGSLYPKSPDGNNWACGPDNSGVWTCSLR